MYSIAARTHRTVNKNTFQPARPALQSAYSQRVVAARVCRVILHHLPGLLADAHQLPNFKHRRFCTFIKYNVCIMHTWRGACQAVWG